MFLIQRASGGEQVYHSLAEFAAAIRRGEVAPSSLIFHRATARWISVTAHPEHRKYMAELQGSDSSSASPAGEPGTPLSAEPLQHLAGIGTWLARKTAAARTRCRSLFS